MGDVNPRLQVRISFQKAGIRAPSPLHRFLDNNEGSVRIPCEPPTVRVFLTAQGKFADREVRRNGLRERQAHEFTHDPFLAGQGSGAGAASWLQKSQKSGISFTEP